MTEGPDLGWPLAIALVALLGFAVAVAHVGRLPIRRDLVAASARAVAQLLAVSLIIAAAIERPWTAVLFAGAMFAVSVWTAAGRVAARSAWFWIAAALASGVVPVLVLVFSLQAAAFTGPAIVPIAGIVIGGTMTAFVLTARRAFDTMRAEQGQIEAGVALGLPRPFAITNVISQHAPEALTPVLDQTRTVGLVSLPGAFIGVLLGGGSATDAAASQLLVLIGLLASETTAVVMSNQLIARGRILPADLRDELPVG